MRVFAPNLRNLFLLVLAVLALVLPAPVLAANGASVTYNTLPSQLKIGQTYWAILTFKNTGTTTWAAAGGYSLGMYGNSDPFAPYSLWGRQPVPKDVAPGQEATFVFPLTAGSEDSPSGVSDWRMIQNSTWFGSSASRTASVGSPTYETDAGYVLGLHSHDWNRDFFRIAPSAEIPYLKNARICTSWQACESTKGMFSWWQLDWEIQTLKNAGVCNILLIVGMPVPQWAWQSWRTRPDSSPPQNIADWENFCAKLAEHCAGRIDYYEILQEPGWDIDAPPSQQGIVYFGGQAETEYMPLLRSAYTAIKANDPTGMVVCGALLCDLSYDYNRDFATYNTNLDQGLANYCDYIGCHPYYHWSRWGEYIRNLRTSVTSHSVSASRIMVTEVGTYSKDWHNGSGSEEDQRLGIQRGIAGMFNEGARKVYIYEDIDEPPGQTWDQDYGLLNYLGVPHPSWGEYRNWQNLISKNEPVKPPAYLKETHSYSQATLTWMNMFDCQVTGTMIRYKTTGYPTSPTDGTLLVSMPCSRRQIQSHTHTGLVNGQNYYYSAFAYDSQPRYSPAATISVIANDVTPPSTPAIDDGVFTPSLDTLHASWSSTDPDTGIAEYQYAIGKTAGATDVVTWTSAGTATEVTRAGLTLTMGQKYYFSVKAKNGFGSWSAVGQSNGIVIAQEVTIIEAKSLTEGDWVGFRRVVVSSATSDLSARIFVQDPNRPAGIWAMTSFSPEISVGRGDEVDICGSIMLGSAGHLLENPSVEALSADNSEPSPVSMGNRSVAGAKLNQTELGADDPQGAYNVGVLVRTLGRVTYAASTTFYIDDGSGIIDPVSKQTGLRVTCSGTRSTVTVPIRDQYVAVTGLSQVMVSGPHRIKMIQVRDQNDIQILQ